MANVRLGTFNQDVVEFLVFDKNDKQCASIYYVKRKIDGTQITILASETIGRLPYEIEKDLEKLKKIAKDILEKD